MVRTACPFLCSAALLSLCFLGKASAQPPQSPSFENIDEITCEGRYPHHLQGVCISEDAIFWSFTTQLMKTDLEGNRLLQVPVANHHGDLCFHDGQVYVAVNLGKFNDPAGNADSWVYVYDPENLRLVSKHATPEVFYGAGGIGARNGHFVVVGGLPADVDENYVYEYDARFQFLKKHVIESGHTRLGIQTAAFAHDRWWFGCYGSPAQLLVTDESFAVLGRYTFDCSLGVVGISQERLLCAAGDCNRENGCAGRLRLAVPNEQQGLRLLESKSDSSPEEF